MSDPKDIPGRRQLPRAQPLQPDRPLSGETTDGETETSDDDLTGTKTAERQKAQSETALSNVKKGYGG